MLIPKGKRVLAIGDYHCGHRTGLTPPEFENSGLVDPHHYAIRRTTWDWYEERVKAYKPQIVIYNGDAIDGKGQASGASELLYADRNVQVDMAVACLKAIPGRPKIVMSYGTAYHTGKEEDFEDQIADKVKAVSIGGEDVIDVNGLLINYRHHLGSSSVPHGRATAISKEVVWNWLWALRGEYPMADVILRSHVHYNVGAFGPGWLGMSLPALQGYGSKYGGRRMSGTVDVGMAYFNVVSKQEYSWDVDILRYPAAATVSL
jgi:hypothetical protein